MKIKTTGIILACLAAAGIASASTNDIATLVQKGLFEEQANHHLDAAIEYYQEAIGHFDKERQLTATAIFRLGECYRLQGKTNEANDQYQRIVREFSDQSQLVELSRGYLTKTGGSASIASGVIGAAAGLPNAGGGVSSGTGHSTFTQNLTRISGRPTSLDFQQQAEIRRLKDMIQNSPDLMNAPAGFNSRTPMQTEVNYGFLAAAELLLTNGADVDSKASSGESPLLLAVGRGDQAMVELLLSYHADVNRVHSASDKTPLLEAVDAGNRMMAEILIDHSANVNALTRSKKTPLHEAASHGFLSLADLLIAHGAAINARDEAGETPLFLAVSGNYPKLAHLLLQHSADPNLAADPHQYSPNIALDFAVLRADTNVVEDLISHHADVNATDQKGRPPLAYLSEIKDANLAVEIKRMLIKAGAKEEPEKH
jgi:ankyrin repeat protein